MSSSLETTHQSNSLREYAVESARPLVSMTFVAPLLIVYELGVVVLGPHALRNGADTWLRRTLESIGFGQYFLLPILTCGILLAWHHTRHDKWEFSGSVLTTMLLESMLIALLAWLLALGLGSALAWILLRVINVRAFGWSLPWALPLDAWAINLGFSLLAAVLATIYPILRSRRISITAGLREE